MSIYSNDNIRKIAKLTTRELPQKSKNAKITVRENNGLYSIVQYIHVHNVQTKVKRPAYITVQMFVQFVYVHVNVQPDSIKTTKFNDSL